MQVTNYVLEPISESVSLADHYPPRPRRFMRCSTYLTDDTGSKETKRERFRRLGNFTQTFLSSLTDLALR